MKITAFPKVATGVEPSAGSTGASVEGTTTPKKGKYVPRCPEIELWMETTHNVRYLELAARWAITGLSLLALANVNIVGQWLADLFNAMLIGLSYAVSCCYPHWRPIFVELDKDLMLAALKICAYVFLMRAFIVAVRKLPTIRI